MERFSAQAARAAMRAPEPDTKEARAAFRARMEAFAAAYRHELTDEAIPVYWLALRRIPEDIRDEAMARCTLTLRFFPTVAELVAAAADVADERRAVAARTAKALRDGCPDCHGSGWREAARGVVRCTCHARALALMTDAPRAIRPALPPKED